MKKITTLLFILIAAPFYAQWWVPQNSGITASLHDVFCVSEDFVVAVGDGGVILKTTDGGATWVQKASGTPNSLAKVQFLNSDEGFIVGGNGTLLKTIDGGESWVSIDSGTTTNLYGLSVLNENSLFISGDGGLMKKTVDGGITFETQNTASDMIIFDIQYLNGQTGYAQAIADVFSFDKKLFKTADGGITWSLINDNATSFFFLDENTGFIVNGGQLYKTTDGGINLTYSGFSGYNVTAVFSLNENLVWGLDNAYALCGCSSHCIVKNELVNTDEYGTVSNCNFGGGEGIPFEAIHFANPTTGFAVGMGGAIYKNTTGTMEPLEVNDFDKNNFVKVYPNPSSEKVTVSFDNVSIAPFSIEMTDLSGKKIFANSYKMGNSATIDVTSFSKGLYLLTIISPEKRQTQKIIVN